MAFKKKTWKDRLVEFAGRRTLTRVSGSADSSLVVDVTRNEGTVSQEGDAFSAKNMNDLEQRIADEFSAVNNNLVSNIYVGDDGKLHKVIGGADTVLNFKKVLAELFKVQREGMYIVSLYFKNYGATKMNMGRINFGGCKKSCVYGEIIFPDKQSDM